MTLVTCLPLANYFLRVCFMAALPIHPRPVFSVSAGGSAPHIVHSFRRQIFSHFDMVSSRCLFLQDKSTSAPQPDPMKICFSQSVQSAQVALVSAEHPVPVRKWSFDGCYRALMTFFHQQSCQSMNGIADCLLWRGRTSLREYR